MWNNITELHNIFKSSFLRGLGMVLGSNFSYDFFSILIEGKADPYTFFAPPLLAWIFVGYITGTIAKGIKNGFLAAILVVVIILLCWILISVVAGEDLMSLFQGKQLILTLGGIIGAFLGASFSSVLGSYISGPEEVTY